jgi:hypothetical protein
MLTQRSDTYIATLSYLKWCQDEYWGTGVLWIFSSGRIRKTIKEIPSSAAFYGKR